MTPRERTSFDLSEAGDLVRRLGPELEELWRTYGVPPSEADRLLGETLIVLAIRKDSARNAEALLLDTVRGRCEQRLRERLETCEGPEN